MKWFIIVAVLVCLISCAELANWTDSNQGAIDTAMTTTSVIGGAAVPFTMGWSELIAWAVTSLVPIGIAINRGIVAKQRAGVIREANAATNSPLMRTQVTSTMAKATVQKLVG